ncbi:MAG: Flp pilus assembly complex ATPase component TadA [Thermoplasmata archaeon]|nr:Flp pilus assembly complex ATPase component TadA [Thermoplasmata archaeon]
MGCTHEYAKGGGIKSLIINCKKCEYSSSLLDENCRNNILSILSEKARIDRLVLAGKEFVKIFDMDALNLLKSLAFLREEIASFNYKINEKCKECLEEEIKWYANMSALSEKDIISAYKVIKAKIEMENRHSRPVILEKDYDCNKCKKEFLKELKKMLRIAPWIGEEESDYYYIHKIQPYIKPIFFDSYIKLFPPDDAVFIKKYEIDRRGKSIEVSLYSLSSRPEKLYFIIPPEYNLDKKYLELLQEVKEELARHRPEDTSFMEEELAREYFMKFAREKIKEIAEEKGMNLNMEQLQMLADIFAKYTAGLGLLEDLLMDKNIQDIYINAPVESNPVHIVWQGEEYTSNIYFSENDVETLSSRFRSISGRPFSEASPILDMGLEDYKARIAAIASPLTPKGVAFAIRRHSITPWTLPKFISNRMLSSLAAGLLSFLIDGQATILIAGSRGAGKSSLLSSLILEIPQRYRILTIEDTPEIPVDELQFLGYKIQSLITQSITAMEGSGIEPETALRTALRLGESVLILGEVRGEETKVLFEAMRVGAAGNIVLGTIHGATTRDVFERIVYDIGVPPTSFKATDIVVVAAPIRVGGGVEKRRRVIQISEIVKRGWGKEIDPDKIFADIMRYDAKDDELKATDLLDMGQSEIIEMVAMQWGISIEEALENIALRTKIKEEIVKKGERKPSLMEAPAIRDANNAFWILIEESKEEHGKPDYKEVEKKWMKWYSEYAKGYDG